MANLGKVIYINEEDYSTLLNGGSITKGGTTYTYDSTALYVIKDVSAPEYAETAGYATSAGQATKATQDGSGNNIVSTYATKSEIPTPIVFKGELQQNGINNYSFTFLDITTFSEIYDAVVTNWTNRKVPVIIKGYFGDGVSTCYDFYYVESDMEANGDMDFVSYDSGDNNLLVLHVYSEGGDSLYTGVDIKPLVTTDGTSNQFVKGDGSLDSTTYTPQTSAGANSLLSSLPDWTATPTDTTKLVRRDTGGSASFGQITFLTVWNYIKSKISSVLGIGGDNGTPTAPTAASGTNTTQIATTAFVQAAVSGAGGGVQSISCSESDILASTTTTNTTSTAIWTALQAGKMPLLYSGTSGFSIVIQDMGGGYWSGNGVDATNKKLYNVYGYQGSIVSGVATLMAAASDVKAPLIIAVPDENDTLTSGTYASITTALAAGREVLLKATMSTEDDQDVYLHLLSDETVNDNGYYFCAQRGKYNWAACIMDDESITFTTIRLASYSELTSMVGDIETLLAAI